METRRWLDQSQPQTLVNAVLLSYIHAAFEALSAIGSPFYLVIAAAIAASAYGIANEKKFAWYAAIGLAIFELLPYALSLTGVVSGILANPLAILGILFIVVRLVLLLHPQSRDYVRIWFK